MVTLWDLTVSNVHTFAVGTGAYVVHNCGVDGVPDAGKKIKGQPNLYPGQRVDPFKLASDGWRVTRQAIGGARTTIFGSDFFAFLRSTGRSTLGWRYYMETWERGAGRTWRITTGQTSWRTLPIPSISIIIDGQQFLTGRRLHAPFRERVAWPAVEGKG